ncbi:MAG: response regulator transcription factor [Bacteroidetes bacterium]|jgi:DNA-binding LytR/AlgR family response regulator|nr:response regulator transcription factor [Bacteroidota bacterium]MBK8330444.1 response regulator transcription factor [Bacteroidota bacterium]
MIKAIAIDDEPPALKIIETFCSQSENIQLEKTFSKPNDALKYINNYPVDLIFLDIQMPSISGIDFYKSLETDAMVIFTTAYSEYAVEGFNLNAIDFLLKPFTQERFNQAVAKAYDYHNHLNNDDKARQPFLFIRADYSLIKININDIIYLEGLNDYVKFHLENQKPIIARMTLKMLVDRLPSAEFIRAHRSYIVPIKKISYIRNRIIHLNENDKDIEIPIGKSYEDDVLSVCKPN